MNDIKLVSYNIRFGLGLEQRIDLERIAKTVQYADFIALQEVENCKLLRWFKKGDDIFIDKNMMEYIVFQVKSYLRALH